MAEQLWMRESMLRTLMYAQVSQDIINGLGL